MPSFAEDAGQHYRDPDAGDGGCATPNVLCSGTCVAVTTDPNHCGACDKACIGARATCLAGQCACDPGFDYCAGVGCMDVQTDVNNCGSCGNVCDPNQFDSCVGGQCASSM